MSKQNNISNKVTNPPKLKALRLFKCMWRQKSKTAICPEHPRLDGKLAIVTGGNDGIGFETSKGLVQRGAEVIILARNENKSKIAINKIDGEFNSKVHFICMDLSDLESVFNATQEISERFSGRKVDLLVANAGIAPKEYSVSAQGYENAFAVNVLGNHALLRACLDKSLLHEQAHIISVAGDIYFLETECTSDYKFESESDGTKSYCRSKLGVMWWAQTLMLEYPDLWINIVHPGVVASNLSGDSNGFVRSFFRKYLLISPKLGAQTSLICATKHGVVKGGYYHNTMGKVELSPADAASDSKKAMAFWRQLESITSEYLSREKSEKFI